MTLYAPVRMSRAAFACVLLLTLLAPFTGGGLSLGGLLALRAFTLIGVACWLLAVLHGASLGRPQRWPLLALGALLAWSLLSALLSPAPWPSLTACADPMLWLLAALLGNAVVNTRKRRHVWLGTLLAGAVLLAVYGTVQFLGHGWTPRLTPARVSSLYYNSNHYAGLLGLVLPVALALALETAGWRRWAALALTLLLAANLLWSFSWAGLFVLAVCTVLLVRRVWRGRPLEFRLLSLGLGLGAAALLAAAALALSPQLAPGSWTTRASELQQTWVQQSLGSRSLIWQGSVQIARAAPLLGAGPGQFEPAFTLYRSPVHRSFSEAISHSEVNYAHSDFLQVASETGLPGLLAFLAFWALALFSGQGPLAAALRPGLAALLLYGLTDCNLTEIPGNALLAYLVAGVLLGTDSLVQRSKGSSGSRR